jgi:hypothetical protein
VEVVLEAHDDDLADPPADTEQGIGRRRARRIDHEHAGDVLDHALRFVLVDDLDEPRLALVGHPENAQQLVALVVPELAIRVLEGSVVDDLAHPARVLDEELVDIDGGRSSASQNSRTGWRSPRSARSCTPASL